MPCCVYRCMIRVLTYLKTLFYFDETTPDSDYEGNTKRTKPGVVFSSRSTDTSTSTGIDTTSTSSVRNIQKENGGMMVMMNQLLLQLLARTERRRHMHELIGIFETVQETLYECKSQNENNTAA